MSSFELRSAVTVGSPMLTTLALTSPFFHKTFLEVNTVLVCEFLPLLLSVTVAERAAYLFPAAQQLRPEITTQNCII